MEKSPWLRVSQRVTHWRSGVNADAHRPRGSAAVWGGWERLEEHAALGDSWPLSDTIINPRGDLSEESCLSVQRHGAFKMLTLSLSVLVLPFYLSSICIKAIYLAAAHRLSFCSLKSDKCVTWPALKLQCNVWTQCVCVCVCVCTKTFDTKRICWQRWRQNETAKENRQGSFGGGESVMLSLSQNTTNTHANVHTHTHNSECEGFICSSWTALVHKHTHTDTHTHTQRQKQKHFPSSFFLTHINTCIQRTDTHTPNQWSSSWNGSRTSEMRQRGRGGGGGE